MRKRTIPAMLGALSLSLTAYAATPDQWTLPVSVQKLDNGLTVIVSEDHSSPTVGVSVVYHVGMRLEPKNRTGFAHLFEHLMFQGTPNAPKGVFDKAITGGGGRNNGSTRADFTNYIETAPVSALDSIMWLEADRMKTLDFNPATLKNQQDVVKEEIRVNVKNQPYGGFMWIDISQQAFQKWENNHDGYGSFEDLEGASLDDVRAFHRDYYGPNNAVLSIAGDVTPAQGFALAKKYFAVIPKRPVPAGSDFTEGLNSKEKRIEQSDALAQAPAIAAAWKMPARGSKDQAAMAVLGEVLAGGDASMFYQGLVKGKEIALNLDNLYGLTGPWEFDGPTCSPCSRSTSRPAAPTPCWRRWTRKSPRWSRTVSTPPPCSAPRRACWPTGTTSWKVLSTAPTPWPSCKPCGAMRKWSTRSPAGSKG